MWGWTDKRVRLLLANEGEWTDPDKAERWSEYRRANEGPAEGQLGANEGPAEGQNDQPGDDVKGAQRASRGPAEGQNGASQGPAEGHRRADLTDTDTDTAPTGEKGALPDPPTEIDHAPPWARGWRGNTAVAVTEAVLRALSAIRQEPVTTRCNGDARLFRSLWQSDGFPPVGELASDVEDVSRWARESAAAEDELRGRNARGVQWRPDRSTSTRALLDPKAFGDYRAQARRWKATGDLPPPPAARGSPVNGRRMGHAGDGVLEAMWRERNPPSEVYDGDG